MLQQSSEFAGLGCGVSMPQTNLLKTLKLRSLEHNASGRIANLNIPKQKSRSVVLHCDTNNIIQSCLSMSA